MEDPLNPPVQSPPLPGAVPGAPAAADASSWLGGPPARPNETAEERASSLQSTAGKSPLDASILPENKPKSSDAVDEPKLPGPGEKTDKEHLVPSAVKPLAPLPVTSVTGMSPAPAIPAEGPKEPPVKPVSEEKTTPPVPDAKPVMTPAAKQVPESKPAPEVKPMPAEPDIPEVKPAIPAGSVVKTETVKPEVKNVTPSQPADMMHEVKKPAEKKDKPLAQTEDGVKEPEKPKPVSGFTGRVRGVRGQIVEVSYDDTEFLPKFFEILTSPRNEKIRLEVYGYGRGNVLYCLSLTKRSLITRNMPVTSTGAPIMIPVGSDILGRVMNLFGEAQDNKGDLTKAKHIPIYGQSASFGKVITSQEVLETGIKMIDFFTPFIKGGKIGLVGGAGVGKTVIMTELLRNITYKAQGVAMFAGIGERIREGHELMKSLEAANVLSRVALIFGQMNENAIIRFRVAWAASSIAEYFREEEHKDILFFADNVYRFIQAGAEVSAVLGSIPSELGYQATLETEISNFENRLVSTPSGSITSVQTVYVPSDELSDVGVAAIISHLDGVVILSRAIASRGHYPPIDPLLSSSSTLNKKIVGEEHYRIATLALETLHAHQRLARIVAIVGVSELSPADQSTYNRAKKLLNYMTQPFATVEAQSGQKGVTVAREKTIKDVAAIIEGKVDQVPEEKLKFIGSLEDAKLL